MRYEELNRRHESVPKMSLDAPAIESFLDPARATEIWPANIATNETFLEQTKKRKELNKRLTDIIDSLPQPDMSLGAAINQEHITEDQLIKLYTSLSSLLESDQDYKRLILYLPFEFLPKTSWYPSGEKLQQATERFREAYLEAWRSLLSIYDVRANFVDGDVLEEEHRDGDHPRVVKAAHLVPKLVEQGLLQVKDVIIMMEESDDQILKDSIADTLPVLADLGLITKKEMDLMEKSKDQLVNNMSRIIASNMQTKEPQPETALENVAIASVQEKIYKEFSQIDSAEYGDITKKRKIWLKQKKKQEVIGALSKDISTVIVENKLTDEAAESFLTLEANTTSQQALTEGIRKAIESVAAADPEKASVLYARYKNILLTLWEKKDPAIRESLAKTFRRLHRLNIVDNKQLAEFNIVMPKLAGPYSENLKNMRQEMPDIQNMSALIESNPELSKFLYPVIMLYGSHLKGYGEPGADIDLGVFVKPGTSLDNRKKLQDLLKKNFTHEKIQGEIVEFWLEKKDNQLSVRNFKDSDVLLGESYWTHILFGAAWEGNKNVIRELREKLLSSYLYDSGKMIDGRDARSLYLEELERDTLQYRLMHKGYERFYPSYSGIHTPHSDEIDGDSMFWDSGYRQLATKLFVSRVFLPKIPVPEK